MTDDLTSIEGVGPTIAEALREAGFETVDDVESATVDELAEVTFVGEPTARAILGYEDGNTRGRPCELEDHIDDIMSAAEQGLSKEGIARVAGVGYSTLREWENKFDDFAAELKRHRSVGERRLIDGADPEFILERSYGYTKEQEIEHTGDGLDLTLDADEKAQLDELFDVDPQE